MKNLILLIGIIFIAGCVGQTAETGSEDLPLEQIKEKTTSGEASRQVVPPTEETTEGPINITDLKFYGYPGQSQGIAWSPDGRKLAIGYLETVQIFDISSGHVTTYPIKRFVFDNLDWIRHISWNSDNKKIAVSADKGIKIIDMSKGEVTQNLSSYKIGKTLWNPDGTKLAYSRSDILITDNVLNNILKISSSSYAGNTFDFLEMAEWSRDGSKVMSIYKKYTYNKDRIVIWDTSNGAVIKEINTDTAVLSSTWNLDGKQVAYIDDLDWKHQKIIILDASTGDLVKSFDAPDTEYEIAWSPDGGKLAARSRSRVTIWDTSTWNILNTFTYSKGDTGDGMTWSPDGRRLAFMGDAVYVKVIE